MTDTSKLVQPQVVCPHCWHKFYADHAFYISRHAELKNDPVLGQFQNRRFAPHEVERRRDGAVLDPKGWEMLERACPQCHLQIPPELLTRKPFFISVVGAPRSGKTYFLTSMIHWLREELARNFGFSLKDSDSHEVRAFQEYEQTLFFASDPAALTFLTKTEEFGSGNLYNYPLLNGVEVQLPKPCIFSLRPTQANLNAQKPGMNLHGSIVLYDNAGESFEPLKEKEGSIRVTQHLSESEAVLFTFDPLQDPATRLKLQSISQDPQLKQAAVSYRQEAILSEVINRMRRYSNRPEQKKLKPVLAVCVQKYDVWKTLLKHSAAQVAESDPRAEIDQSSVEFSKREGIAGLDVEEINRVSLLVRGFVEELNPDFVALAESNFKVVRYFPVSALGTSPEFDGQSGKNNLLKVRPKDLQPFRVTHPLLWLLHRWQFLLTYRKREDLSQKYRHMSVQGIVDGTLRLVSPCTGRLVILDHEYEGTAIVDPTSPDGEIVWVPRFARRVAGSDGSSAVADKATPSAAPPSVAAPPGGSGTSASIPPSFKLASEPKAPKKRWFRKS